jgi:hypothetical protein
MIVNLTPKSIATWSVKARIVHVIAVGLLREAKKQEKSSLTRGSVRRGK